ncbi:MAG: LLM class flavin-dependent oxidoreductase [Edaphocola sp.]
MEIGISMFGDVGANPQTGKFNDAGRRIREILEEVKLADQGGLDVFGMGEHHRPDYAVSSPEILLAAAASVTQNIKLGSAVSVLSSSDPVRIYQNFSTLDLISSGRAEIVAGRGSFTESFPLFGFDLKDYDKLFSEKLELLMAINKNEEITWSGKFRPPLEKQQVLPRAQQKELPIWLAVGGTPESVQRAARLGLPLMLAIIGGSPSQFIPYAQYYKTEYLKHGHKPEEMRIGVHSHAFLGDDGKQVADAYYPYYAAQMNNIGRTRGWPPYSKVQFEAGRTLGGAVFVGDARQVTEKILKVQEELGLTRFMAHIDVGAAPHGMMMKTIEILADKVAPAVRKALVPRTG